MRNSGERMVWALLVALVVAAMGCRQELALDRSIPTASKPESGKVAGDLEALYREYGAHRQAGSGAFAPSDSGVRVIDERVLVDAVAADDAGVLAGELRALGAVEVAVFGRTVSAQLPIAAIEDLETLQGLKSVRASTGQTR